MFGNKKTISLTLVLALVLVVEVANADYVFGTPTNLGPVVNSDTTDVYPSITADNLELYFASQRSGGVGGSDIWLTTRESTQDPWGEPVNLGPAINSSGWEGDPCPSADGLTLYYGGTAGLMVTRRTTKGDIWGPPVALGPEINHSSDDRIFSSISSDGLELYLSEYGMFVPGGFGLSDLWVSTRSAVGDEWGQPLNLGPTVNSSAHDRMPSISADNLMLFFVSTRSGGYGNNDLWVVRRATQDDNWTAPVNIGPAVNSSSAEAGPGISADGRTLYFHSNRSGGSGGNDLWQVSIDPIVDLNGDGIVDCADMCIMVDYWGTNEPLCDIGPMPWGDGVVDVQDLIVLAEHLFEGYGVIERRISAGSDDAEEAMNSGYSNWNDSSDLEIVDDHIDNGGSQLIGLTFRDIDIPPGEVIGDAYVEFVCDETINGTDDAYFLIWGHLTPNSEGFVAPFVISNRPKTEAKVPWEPDTWNAGGQTIQTVNIAPIIQELIDQEDWVAGNAVEIIIGADPDKPAFTGVRCAESYESSASIAPLLHIEIAVP